MKKSKISLLSEAIKATKFDQVPDEWFTAEEVASDAGLSLSHTSRTLRRLIKLGEVEVRVFKVERNGVRRAVPHYHKVK
jgi:predicted transcriptional regulator